MGKGYVFSSERYCVGVLFLIVFLCGQLAGQEVTATINGLVTDPSGAAIVGAKLTANDMARGTA